MTVHQIPFQTKEKSCPTDVPSVFIPKASFKGLSKLRYATPNSVAEIANKPISAGYGDSFISAFIANIVVASVPSSSQQVTDSSARHLE